MKKSFLLLFFSLVILNFFSCRPHKELVYFQDLHKAGLVAVNDSVPLHILKTNDNLYVDVKSLNPEISQMFSNTGGAGGNMEINKYNSPTNQYVFGYIINTEGDIELPILGKVHMAGLNLEQARDSIQSRADEYLNDATVTVKLLNNRFTVMGEVKKPGAYFNNSNELNVLEALAIAGDVTVYGELKKVLVIRPTDNGNETYRLDLTSKEAFLSDAYYIQSNDIIYVEAAKLKGWNTGLSNYSLVLTGLTALISILTFLK
ncbi:polysaccharide biosynthesis/export family protein [Aureibacter tunicatorum]|uniref:Polysaccharide export outer membrane protein n=1 Tax=Aureibacter tunicatorum TaxID=866807 RepID=A0AAE3XPJ8_9BACT|nr:polysaccharide biosynthesis/export family protein [Aureibacter tunicatorum]MDR6240782.1 polysaccharide export outer membrane protein [Aureibacter tunicatorum]BDD06885.1 sugar transporter [Aureibacter tunicatorum]